MFQRNNLDPGLGAIIALVIVVLLGGARFFSPLSQAGPSLDAGVLTIGGLAILAALGIAIVNRKMQARELAREWETTIEPERLEPDARVHAPVVRSSASMNALPSRS